jgi:uncharacterized Rossmann fold enzyme
VHLHRDAAEIFTEYVYNSDAFIDTVQVTYFRELHNSYTYTDTVQTKVGEEY